MLKKMVGKANYYLIRAYAFVSMVSVVDWFGSTYVVYGKVVHKVGKYNV